MRPCPSLREQLRRQTGKARRRHAAIEREIEKRRGLLPEPGDLFVLTETADHAVEWAILDRDAGDPKWLLAVPADAWSIAGSADVRVAEDAPRGPLSLHCAHGVWIQANAFDAEMRTGFLEPETLQQARRKCLELERRTARRAGSAASTPGPRTATLQSVDPEIYSTYRLEIRDTITERRIWCGSDLSELSAILVPEGSCKLRLLRPTRRPDGTIHRAQPARQQREKPGSVDAQHEMTQLLRQWHSGDKEALDRLMPMVVSELRRIARGHFARESASHTLQPTALVNEVYLRLVDAERIEWQGRAHFFGIAARLMRCVLVDHARGRQAAKRGGEVHRTVLEIDQLAPASREVDLLELDDALAEMSRINPEGSRIVEMRYFTGLTLEEIAEVLGVSRTTVKRKWRAARIWLHRELSRDTGSTEAAGGDRR